jgi:CubicO group peptidase (beta-lactamase class C family)
MVRIAFSLLLGLLLATPCCAQQADLRSHIDEEVHQSMKKWNVPGAALVVILPNDQTILGGYGLRDINQQSPVSTRTMYPLASCTKSFTTMAMAMLVDDGKMKWDDPVRKHDPSFHLSDPHVDALVTLRDLVSHRTGVGSHDYLWYRAPWTQDEMIRRAGKLPLDGQFRSSFAYQSIMFMEAGKIVGMYHPHGWEGFVRERILQPLGMNSTFTTSVEASRQHETAIGYRFSREGRQVAMPAYPMPEPNPAGSIFCNAKDLAKWLQFQLGDGTWQGKRLVSAEAFGETHRSQNIIPSNEITRSMNPETVQLTYGMGWVIQDYRGVKVFAHAGLIDGFRCQLTLLPEHGIAIGLLDNLHQTRMNLALTNRLIDLLLGLPEKDWNGYFSDLVRTEAKANQESHRRREELRKKGEKPTVPLAAFAGRYENPAYGTAAVRLENGKLKWSWGAFGRDLLAYHGNTFELRDVILDEQDVEFVAKGDRIVRMKALGVDFERTEN